MQNAINTEIHAMAIQCHFDVTAFAAYMDSEGMDIEEAAREFQDRYAGTHASLEAWAENFAEETGMLAEVPEALRRYFDFEAWARDCALNGEIWTIDTSEGVAVFWH